MPPFQNPELHEGRSRLATPVLPLVRLACLLYLTGPFERMEEVVQELPAPVEAGGVLYEDGAAALAPLLPFLRRFEALKAPAASLGAERILEENLTEADPFEALELQVAHAVMAWELEAINSLLCGPCRCTLCCIGPEAGMQQEFFEIPLAGAEAGRFDVPRRDTAETRGSTSAAEPPLAVDDLPFYQGPPALIHWRTGWSLILPRGSRCPSLLPDGRCRIYADRPDVCRRPQIFSYVLEGMEEEATGEGGNMATAWIARRKLLAVWDCPYVRELKDEIARYAELCGLEPVFRHSKA